MTKRIFLSTLAAAMMVGAPGVAEDAAGISPDLLAKCSGLYEALSEGAKSQEEFETFFHFGGGFKNAAYEAMPEVERSDRSRVQQAIDAKRNAILADIEAGSDPMVAAQADMEQCSLAAAALGLVSPSEEDDREVVTVQ